MYIRCSDSYAIHYPLAKVARLKHKQNIPKVRYYMYAKGNWNWELKRKSLCSLLGKEDSRDRRLETEDGGTSGVSQGSGKLTRYLWSSPG